MFKKISLLIVTFITISSCSKNNVNNNEMAVGTMMESSQEIVSHKMIASDSMMMVSQPMIGFNGNENFDKYENTRSNRRQITVENPISTFSIDVDTSSYANVRRFLQDGTMPVKDAVRTEEMVNYFDYNYAPPQDKNKPFATYVNIIPNPWNANTKLLHIAIKGYEINKKDRPKSNLVFLVDTSGSMIGKDRLSLLKKSLAMLVNQMGKDDTIAIITYAGNSTTALEPTSGDKKRKILTAISNLESGGITNGEEGIKKAYQLAEINFDEKAINRIILATDGDFNFGISDSNLLEEFVANKSKKGIYLSVLGFGRGNYNDLLMQKLAQSGNGNASYIDNVMEAKKVLVEEMSANLFPIANDVKIQIEFNPQTVAEYRLIGYETRLLDKQDFNNDKVDAGDIGAGHDVTAIYEIIPTGSKAISVDPLRYSNKYNIIANNKYQNEYAELKIRYKLPNDQNSQSINRIVDSKDVLNNIESLNQDIKFSLAVAGFAGLLRNDSDISNFTYDDVLKLAKENKGEDEFGYRSEFIQLVNITKSILEYGEE